MKIEWKWERSNRKKSEIRGEQERRKSGRVREKGDGGIKPPLDHSKKLLGEERDFQIPI